MIQKKDVETPKKYAPFISLLLGIAVIATTTAYIIYRYVNNRAYRKKWSDYDECGLA